MGTYLRPRLEALSTQELIALQADACAHMEPLAERDPLREKTQQILDTIIDVLTARLDDEMVVNELERLYAL